MHFRIGKRKLRGVGETRNVVERKGKNAEKIEREIQRYKKKYNNFKYFHISSENINTSTHDIQMYVKYTYIKKSSKIPKV
jgi:hypothetical protein